MSVPVIDLTASEASVVEQVGAACERIGFFTITNHGVPAEVIERAWLAASIVRRQRRWRSRWATVRG
jgi:isopenicillin N synthase-like dioxygenase